ncbi:MAG: DUF3179 domain-containing protein, partial [Thermoplasmata archaeon]
MGRRSKEDAARPKRGVRRRDFLKYTLAAGGVALGAYLGWSLLRPAPPPPSGCAHTPAEALAIQEEHISITGVRKDGIPSIDSPRFVTAADATSFVADEHIVFGLASNGVARAFPQRILVWHEVVNASWKGAALAVTYCPLTGSQVAYRPQPSVSPTFGVTGRLVNSNLLMYDRRTDSRWPQIFGQAIQGPLLGGKLEAVPLAWTTWARWRTRHPETEVLSTDTGFVRNYQGDPYGSYKPLRGYYADSQVRFHVACRDNRFHPKRPFVGLAQENDAVAVDLELLRADRIRNASIAGQPVAFLHDEGLQAPRAFLAMGDPGPLHLSWDGSFRDAETGSRWSADGVAISGPLEGSRLPELPAMNVMWFAWAAFYPWTRV